MLGPSGSGKTTSLMMLAGFEPATHGEVFLAGRPINNVPPHKRGIGMVFQNYALFPHMTVAENLAFPLAVGKLGKEEIARKVARALEMVELPDFGTRRPAQLSGGQQQRVALARALVFEPDLVLMDEPLVGFDRSLTRAAAGLGAGPIGTFFHVQMPLILPGVISGGLFAFITSFDEVVVVLFLGSASQKTLPWQMFTGLREQISPTILAVATIMVALSIALLATLEVLRRRAERLRSVTPG